MNEESKVKKLRQEFGMAVRRRRHKLELSQEDLADKADIHRTYISSIELGKVDVGFAVGYKISRPLNIALSKLIKEAEDNI